MYRVPQVTLEFECICYYLALTGCTIYILALILI